jgi:hypothetical protein
MIKDSTFVDISDVFDNAGKTVYFDFCHTGELGNKLVAARMFEYLKPVLTPKIQETVTLPENEQLTEINQ